MSDETTEQRLERLRAALRAENIDYGELAELQDLAAQDLIDHGDVELLEAAGVPEAQYRAWQEGRGKIEVDDEGNEVEDGDPEQHEPDPDAMYDAARDDAVGEALAEGCPERWRDYMPGGDRWGRVGGLA